MTTVIIKSSKKGQEYLEGIVYKAEETRLGPQGVSDAPSAILDCAVTRAVTQ